MSKHTPGPWRTHGSYIYAPDGAILAVVHNPGARLSDYPLVPNRDLIAAAPELLEALKAVAPYFEGEHAYDHPHCVQLRDAIAKAEGRQ